MTRSKLVQELARMLRSVDDREEVEALVDIIEFANNRLKEQGIFLPSFSRSAVRTGREIANGIAAERATAEPAPDSDYVDRGGVEPMGQATTTESGGVRIGDDPGPIRI